MSSVSPHPRVGIAVIIRNAKGELVVGKRAGSHGAGTWALPGGHLEMGESFVACAERETLEETGLRVRGAGVVAVTNDVFDAEKHYITIFVECTMTDPEAQPERLEPGKCLEWRWITWDSLREWCAHQNDGAAEWADKKTFLPIQNLVKERPQLDLSRPIS